MGANQCKRIRGICLSSLAAKPALNPLFSRRGACHGQVSAESEKQAVQPQPPRSNPQPAQCWRRGLPQVQCTLSSRQLGLANATSQPPCRCDGGCLPGLPAY